MSSAKMSMSTPLDQGAAPRQRQILLRLSGTEHERLQALAEHYGLTQQNALRMLVKRAHDDLEVDARKLVKRGKTAAR